MRITLDIDDDLLMAAQDLSRQEGRSIGQVVSALLRKALAGDVKVGSADDQPGGALAGSFRPFAPRGSPVTNDAIDRLRDAEGL